MNAWLVAGIVIVLASLAASGSADEGEWWDRDVELELGSFYHHLDDGQPDWLGQRLLVRARPLEQASTQLELTTVRRGARDWGGQAGLAVWSDWTRHLFTVAHASASHGASRFFPQWRTDLELHGKVPTLEQWVLFGGGGRAEFADADTWVTTLGTTYHFPHLGGGSISYRYTHFFNDFEGSSVRGSEGDGAAHLGQLTIGPEHGVLGRFDLRFLYGSDLLRDFVALSGDDAEFESHNVYLGWRRRWTRRFGTDLQLEWGRQDEVYDNRLGAELRFVWYFGPQLEWVRSQWAQRSTEPTLPRVGAR